MFCEHVTGIDFLKLTPQATRLIQLAEVAKGGSEEDARKIGVRHQDNPLSEQSSRSFILPGEQISHAEKVHKLWAYSRIEAHRLLDLGNRFERVPRVEAIGAKKVTG